MARKRIRVLVVDDSPLIRELLGDALSKHADIEVVGTASDGVEALDLMERLQPDLVTLDLEMPRLGGQETLEKLLERRPTPVIVVSALSRCGAEVTMKALDRGAMDYVAKPEGADQLRRLFGEELPQKIRNMAGVDVRRVLAYRKERALRAEAFSKATTKPNAALLAHCAAGCIAIGISTGGPPALSALFSALAPPLPPIVVTQHMPQLFTGPFADRLNSLSLLDVKEAQSGDKLRPNLVLVAPGGRHLTFTRCGGNVQAVVRDGELISGHKPSADVMMQSAAQIFGHRCLGVIMTGMGRDGADGCGAIRAAGGYIIGQDAATSDIYGMNRVAFVEGNVNVQAPLDKLAEAITAHALRLRPLTPSEKVTRSVANSSI